MQAMNNGHLRSHIYIFSSALQNGFILIIAIKQSFDLYPLSTNKTDLLMFLELFNKKILM